MARTVAGTTTATKGTTMSMTSTTAPAHAWDTTMLVGFDTETTGVDPFTDRIVTAAFHHPGTGSATTLVNPGVPIPDSAAAIHGISDERARAEGVAPADALAWVQSMLDWVWGNGGVVAGHNLAFDLTLLDAEMRRHGFGPLTIAGPVFDVYIVDRHVDKYRKGRRTLAALSDHYQVALTHAHTADDDARAATLIAARIAEQFDGHTPDALHRDQVRWASEQAADLQAYFRRTRPDARVDGGWPLRTAD